MVIFMYFSAVLLALKFCLLEIHTSPPNFLSEHGIEILQQPKYALDWVLNTLQK